MRKMRVTHRGEPRQSARARHISRFCGIKRKISKKVKNFFRRYFAGRICIRQNAQTPIFCQNRQLLWVSPPYFPRDDIRMTNNPLYIRKKITQKPVRRGGFLLFFCQKKLIFFCQTPGRRKTAKSNVYY